jgi:hypothetical protein
MVIGRRFAWAHMPKAAGDATCRMLCAVPGLVEFADPLTSHEKHMPFFGREREVAAKLLVMNIRRLPDWAISGAQHKARYGEYPDYIPMPLATPEELSRGTDADDLLRWMTDHGRLKVERWLRTERLEEDVLALLEELGELTDQARAAVLSVGRVNVGEYDRRLSELTGAQVARLYRVNPAWAEVERRVYGDVPID